MFIGKVKENIEPTKVATPQIRNPISKAEEEGQECLPHNKHLFFFCFVVVKWFQNSLVNKHLCQRDFLPLFSSLQVQLFLLVTLKIKRVFYNFALIKIITIYGW
jgi:hypothetical protein